MIVDHTEKTTLLKAWCLDEGCGWAAEDEWTGDLDAELPPPTVSLRAHIHGHDRDHDVRVTQTVTHATTLVVVLTEPASRS